MGPKAMHKLLWTASKTCRGTFKSWVTTTKTMPIPFPGFQDQSRTWTNLQIRSCLMDMNWIPIILVLRIQFTGSAESSLQILPSITSSEFVRSQLCSNIFNVITNITAAKKFLVWSTLPRRSRHGPPSIASLKHYFQPMLVLNSTIFCRFWSKIVDIQNQVFHNCKMYPIFSRG